MDAALLAVPHLAGLRRTLDNTLQPGPMLELFATIGPGSMAACSREAASHYWRPRESSQSYRPITPIARSAFKMTWTANASCATASTAPRSCSGTSNECRLTIRSL